MFIKITGKEEALKEIENAISLMREAEKNIIQPSGPNWPRIRK